MTVAFGYAPPALKGLVSCPFCREMFTKGEAKRCPHCDIDLVRLSQLPSTAEPDDDDAVLAGADTSVAAPVPGEDDRVLPWTHLGHGRGPLLAIAVLGLVAFAMPWVSMTAPELREFNGFDLGRAARVAFAPAVAWFGMIPLVLSRRTVNKMVGSRVPVALLSAVSVVSTALLLLNPPSGFKVGRITIPFQFTWQAGIWITLVLGIVAFAIGTLAFGGWVPFRATRAPER